MNDDKMAKKPKEMPVRESSGNVFEDLGLPESAELQGKAELTARIADRIERLKLTQTAAAKRLGVDQPPQSKLLRGHLASFSTDRLFRFLNALGRDVEITVKPRPRTSTRPGIRVVDSQKREAG